MTLVDVTHGDDLDVVCHFFITQAKSQISFIVYLPLLPLRIKCVGSEYFIHLTLPHNTIFQDFLDLCQYTV